MSIKIGDTLPAGSLSEFIEVETEGCSLGPNTFNVADLTKGKTIAIFGLRAHTLQPVPRNTCRVTLSTLPL